MATIAIATRRLRKNLNAAPFADALQPGVDLARSLLFNNVFLDGCGNLFERRHRIQAAFLRLRYKSVTVVLPDLIVRGADCLTKTHIKEASGPQAIADGTADD